MSQALKLHTVSTNYVSTKYWHKLDLSKPLETEILYDDARPEKFKKSCF